MNIVLLSTYELGRQPFGLASPAAWLRSAGHTVVCADLAVSSLPAQALAEADLVGFYIPMHTATRIAAGLIGQVRQANPHAYLVAFGLYAPVNAEYLQSLGIQACIGGEYEAALRDVCHQVATAQPGTQPASQIVLDRLAFLPPDRHDLPPLTAYASLQTSDGSLRLVGATEASRGCKHRCRHCPIVPVYNGRFRIVPQDVVLEDIRRQVAAGAEHITFGDPDFLNGPRHSMAIVEALHHEFPQLSYDVTIKIEHLLKHADLLPHLRDTGCAFVISAVESVDDQLLQILDKNHTRADFIHAAGLMRMLGLPLSPTFVTFTPWTSRAAYQDLLALVAELGLVEHIATVQYAIRLLIPQGSRLLELPETRNLVGPFDQHALAYPWQHPDPEMDALYQQVRHLTLRRHASRQAAFAQIWELVHAPHPAPLPQFQLADKPIPQLTEPWYC